jgi:hypothetical protein
MSHIPFDVLNDYVDGRLEHSQSAGLARHLAACSSCAREHDSLVSLLRNAKSVAREVLPPSDLWDGVKVAIDRRKEVMLPTANRADRPTERSAERRAPTTPPTPGWRRWALMSAAAVILVVVSSAVTAIVLRRDPGSMITAAIGELGAPGRREAQAAVLPAGFRLAENGYIRTITELHVALDAQRAILKPETVAAIERSLAVVDSAITEARSALLNDPGNRTLVDLLSASYQRKLDLLRHASDLDRRT